MHSLLYHDNFVALHFDRLYLPIIIIKWNFKCKFQREKFSFEISRTPMKIYHVIWNFCSLNSNGKKEKRQFFEISIESDIFFPFFLQDFWDIISI